MLGFKRYLGVDAPSDPLCRGAPSCGRRWPPDLLPIAFRCDATASCPGCRRSAFYRLRALLEERGIGRGRLEATFDGDG